MQTNPAYEQTSGERLMISVEGCIVSQQITKHMYKWSVRTFNVH